MTTTTETPIPSEAAIEALMGKVLTDVAAHGAVRLAAIGDQLGLWKDLAERGAATPVELAERAGIAERYAREWLAGVFAAEYVTWDDNTGRYALPAEAVPIFALEDTPVSFGGVFECLEGLAPVFDELCDAFRSGGGVPQTSFTPHFWAGMARFTNAAFQHNLIPVWLPLVPDIEAKLLAGCDVADVGTGAARALIALAAQYPNSRYVGYDAAPAQVELARKYVAEAGVADRVRIELLDVAAGLPEQFDVITTFDVVHDAVDPAGLLRAIHDALRADGRYLCMDINASHNAHENVGPLGQFFWNFSVQYCMTTSLAHGGAGLGTCGFSEKVALEMMNDAGFTTARRVEIDDPFNSLYEAAQ